MKTKRRLACALALACMACAGPGPIVQHQVFGKPDGAFRLVAVVPFRAHPRLAKSLEPGDVSAAGAAELVSRFVAEALLERGVRVVPAPDVGLAFGSTGQLVPRGDPLVAAQRAAREFGASAVVLGEVLRYRERIGERLGALRPASVAFTLTLFTAPAGQRVWGARFDETQPAFSADPLRVRKYPGSGTRWLSAAEMARWGADEAVAVIPSPTR